MKNTMNAIIIAVVILLLSATSVVHAQEEPTEAAEISYTQVALIVCPDMAEFAGVVMRTRQAGGSMSAMIAVIENQNPTSPIEEFAASMMHSIIREAFDIPQWHGDRARQDAVTRFVSYVDSECMEAFMRMDEE